MTIPNQRISISSVALALLLTGACGGGDASSNPTEAGLKAASEKFTEALYDFNGDALDEFIDPSCGFTGAAAAARAEEAILFVEQTLGVEIEDIKSEVTAAQVDGTRGRTDGEFETGHPTIDALMNAPTENDTDVWPWDYIDGKWLMTDCDSLAVE